MQQHDHASPTFVSSNRFLNYIRTTESIIHSYNGAEPFHLFLKKYFSSNKKHGSRDRKEIAALCYNYFRVCVGVSNEINFTEKTLTATFLCNNVPLKILELFKPELNNSISFPLEKKIALVKKEFDFNKLFPFLHELSDQIDSRLFENSFFIQPKLFIRIRAQFRNMVFEKLNAKKILFEKINDDCLAFANSEKIDRVLDIDREAVIQDYNSQRTLELLTPVIDKTAEKISVWDCCAGSGGKSILAMDTFKNIQLTVSDRRKQILINLQKRFKNAGIKKYHLFPADLEQSPASLELFNIIIADVPCSGSGTWARTPEQLTFFGKNKIEEYATLQQNIIKNILPNLLAGGYILYITCSVFKKENEENVDRFQKQYHLAIKGMDYLKGYEMQADTMFVALLQKEK